MNDVVIFDPTVTTETEVTSERDVLIFDPTPEPLIVAETSGGDVLIFDAPAAASSTLTTARDYILFDAPAEPVTVVDDTGGSVLVITGGRGPAGPAGSSGEGSDYYTHIQDTPTSSWVIEHNLNRYVSVEVYVDDQVGLADIEFIDLNVVSVMVYPATTGIAAVR